MRNSALSTAGWQKFNVLNGSCPILNLPYRFRKLLRWPVLLLSTLSAGSFCRRLKQFRHKVFDRIVNSGSIHTPPFQLGRIKALILNPNVRFCQSTAGSIVNVMTQSVQRQKCLFVLSAFRDFQRLGHNAEILWLLLLEGLNLAVVHNPTVEHSSDTWLCSLDPVSLS